MNKFGKTLFILIIFVMLFCVNATAQDAAVIVAWQKIWAGLQESQWLQSVSIAAQHYNEAMQQRQLLEQLNNRKGGMAGYLQERFMNDVNNVQNQAIRDFNTTATQSSNHMSGKNLADWVYDGANKKAVDLINQRKAKQERAENTSKAYDEYLTLAKKDDPTTEEVNKMNRLHDAIELQNQIAIRQELEELNSRQEEQDYEQQQNRMISAQRLEEERKFFLEVDRQIAKSGDK
jgi:hypothetical protein